MQASGGTVTKNWERQKTVGSKGEAHEIFRTTPFLRMGNALFIARKCPHMYPQSNYLTPSFTMSLWITSLKEQGEQNEKFTESNNDIYASEILFIFLFIQCEI